MTEKPSTRRDFLQGRSAVEALAAIGDSGPLTGARAPTENAACTLSLRRQAMACEFEVRLRTDKDRNETGHGLAALDLIDELEDRLSVYREESAISRLNRAAQTGWASVNDDLWPLLLSCDELHQATGGAFDATTGPLSRAWGFYSRKGRVPAEEELAQALARTGWRHVELDRPSQQLRFAKQGAEVNFNGVGKGYALDQSATLLEREGAEDFLLHGGRSTLLARGHRPDGKPGWGVGLRHPLRPHQRIAELSLLDAAFSTSGSAAQGFVHQGRRYGHVLDPRTGRPAEGVLSASVVAPTGAAADALSTALYVMGPEQAEEFCRRHTEVGVLFVLPDKADRVRVEALNLPDELWRPGSRA